MTNFCQITVRKSKSEDAQAFKDHFNAAYDEILRLTKLLCKSKSLIVQEYIASNISEDPSRLSFIENMISIDAEIRVDIHRNDANDTIEILYDFGKRSPVDDNFLLAVMAIFKHHLPDSEIDRKVIITTNDNDFNDAVQFAALVNPNIRNPQTAKIITEPSKNKNARKLITTLKSQTNRKRSDSYETVNSTYITYEEAATAQKEFEDLLFEDPNIVSIGVIAEKDANEKPTGSYAIEVGVISKKVYERSLRLGQSQIPAKYLIQSGDSKQSKYLNIIILETGPILAQTKGVLLNSPQYHNEQMEERLGVNTGTNGLLLEKTNEPFQTKLYFVSNNHILANNTSFFMRNSILQFEKFNGALENKSNATLHNWVPLKPNRINYFDVAIAQVLDYQQWMNIDSPYRRIVGTPTSIADPFIGINVEKYWSTTGYTYGQIISINQSLKIKYGLTCSLKFVNQICSTTLSQNRDPVSCLIEKNTDRSVGLLSAGNLQRSYFNPLKTVMSSLSISYTQNTDTHKKRKNSGFTIKFITRKFSTAPSIKPAPQLQRCFAEFCTKKPALILACGAILTSAGLFSRVRNTICTSETNPSLKALKLKL